MSDIVAAVFASTGFWAIAQLVCNAIIKSRESKNAEQSAESCMLRGLGHERIMHICNKYIDRGYVTTAELDDLENYLFKPYEALGGNGSAKKVMDFVRNLPLKG